MTAIICRVSYDGRNESGDRVLMKQNVLVFSPTFGSAEADLYEEIPMESRGELSIASMTKKSYDNIKLADDDSGVLYECRLSYTMLNDKGKEVNKLLRWLVQAENPQGAMEIITANDDSIVVKSIKDSGIAFIVNEEEINNNYQAR